MDESAQANLTIKYYNTDHHTLIISDRDVADSLDHFVWSPDLPLINSLNTCFVSRFACRDVTVALSGLGGDDIFAGYSRTWQILNQPPSAINNFCARLLKWGYVQQTLSYMPVRMSQRLKIIAVQNNVLGNYSLSRTDYWSDELEGAINDKYPKKSAFSSATAAAVIGKSETSNTLDLVQQTSRLDLKTIMAAQLLRDMDAVSMALSLDVRFPLNNHRIVEFGFSLPVEWKFSGS